MPYRNKRKRIDLSQLLGAIIFIALFIGLAFLGMFYNSDTPFSSSFFEDVSNAMQWKQD